MQLERQKEACFTQSHPKEKSGDYKVNLFLSGDLFFKSFKFDVIKLGIFRFRYSFVRYDGLGGPLTSIKELTFEIYNLKPFRVPH